jgi:hypothetical protein
MGACGQRGASCSVARRARRARKKSDFETRWRKHHVIHCGANLSLSDGDAASRLRRRHARLPGPNGPPAVRPRRVPLEANAFGVVRGSRGVPGTRSGAGKTNPKPETRPRRSPGFFHACGSGSARGGSREGRHAPRLCCTGAVTRVATAARAEREKAAADILDCARCENGHRGKFPEQKRETWPPLGFRVFFCVSETCRQSPKHENFFQTGMARKSGKSLQRRPCEMLNSSRDVCRVGVDSASRGAVPFPASEAGGMETRAR